MRDGNDTGSGSAEPDDIPAASATLQWLVERSPHAVVVSDGEGIIRQTNAKARALLGYATEEVTGHPVELLVPSHARHSHKASRREFMRTPMERPMGNGRNLWGVHKDGRLLPLEIALTPVRMENGWAILVSLFDLSAHHELERKLRQERDFSNAVIDGLPAVFYVLTDRGRFLRWNRNFEQVTGLNSDELARINAVNLFSPEDQTRVAEAIGRVFETGAAEIEAGLRNASGAYTPYYLTGLRVELNGQHCLTGTGIDISARKRIEAELHHQAHHDSLTGLMNRRSFEELLPLEVERSHRYGSPLSLIMFDIDHFKAVNDLYGHPVGDRILCQVADTLQASMRGSDIVIRWGGEEFLSLLPETKAEAASVLADTLRALLARTRFTGPGKISASLGVTQYRPGESARSLLKRVDDALYQAKEAGRDQVALL